MINRPPNLAVFSLLPALCMLAASATHAHANAKTVQASVTEACPEGSKVRADAQQRLETLTQQMKTLAVDGDPRPHATSMQQLFEHPCFKLMPNRPTNLEAVDSALSLKTFWRHGAEDWFQATLALSATDTQSRYYWVLPGLQPTLTRTSASLSALSSLICPLGEFTCGRETLGWALRADQALANFQQARAARLHAHQSGHRQEPARCGDHLLARGETDFYAWSQCVEGATPKHRLLPLGRLKAPSSGWLTLMGRRGHYRFCDEIRSYDLATGAAYIAQSCSGLGLRGDGSVDHQRTNEGRQVRVKVGTLPLDNLRELAWMLLIGAQVTEPMVAYGQGIPIPEAIRVHNESFLNGLGAYGSSRSSAQTTLRWQIKRPEMRQGQPTPTEATLGAGTLTWPEDYNEATRQHAVFLLQVAEAAFVEGCAPAALPDPLSLSMGHGGVSGLDAKPADLNAAQAQLYEALRHAKNPKQCATPKRAE